MPERYLSDVLREAEPPARCGAWWLTQAVWTIPVGLCVGCGVYALTFGQTPRTGVGFLVAGAVIYWAFRGLES